MANKIKALFRGKEAYNTIAQEFEGLVEVDAELRKKIQDTLLEMYDDICTVCKNNNISLYLLGGSALGAIRHKGFIPWDDDLDVGMSREDYSRFKGLFGDVLGDKYTLNAPNMGINAKARFPKILKKGTIMQDVCDTKAPECQGIFIDIFIIENVPNGKMKRKIKGIYCNLLEFISSQVYFRENRDDMSKEFVAKSGKLNCLLRGFTGFVFSFAKAKKWFDIVDCAIQHKNNQSKDCNIATGRKHYFGEVLSREVYFPGSEAEFCGRKVLVPNDVDEYLSNLYGDYMEIPPLEKRERHFIRKLDFGEN